MIDEEIRKYILEGKWENQYPSAIEYLLEEVKRLREENNKLVNAVKEDNKILKKYIEIIGEIKFLEWAEGTHPVWINNLKEGYKKHMEME